MWLTRPGQSPKQIHYQITTFLPYKLTLEPLFRGHPRDRGKRPMNTVSTDGGRAGLLIINQHIKSFFFLFCLGNFQVQAPQGAFKWQLGGGSTVFKLLKITNCMLLISSTRVTFPAANLSNVSLNSLSCSSVSFFVSSYSSSSKSSLQT